MINEKYIIEEAPHRYDPYMGRYTIEWSELLDGPIEGYIKSDDYIVRNSKGEIVEETKDKLSIEVTKRPDGSFWAHCNEYPHLSSIGNTRAEALRKLMYAIHFEVDDAPFHFDPDFDWGSSNKEEEGVTIDEFIQNLISYGYKKVNEYIDKEIQNTCEGVNSWQPMKTAPKREWILVKGKNSKVNKVRWGKLKIYDDNSEMGWYIDYSIDFRKGSCNYVENPVGWQPLPK